MPHSTGFRYSVRNCIKYHLVNRELEMTQQELAEKTGLHPDRLSRIISGQNPQPSALEAIVISKALGENFEDVFVLVDSYNAR